MNLQRKPRLGVLALMLEGYEPLFPGITRRQTDYVHALLEHLAPAAEFIFPGPAVNAGDMARLVGRYNAEGADGILILLLSYAQGQYLAHALRENCLPLALALGVLCAVLILTGLFLCGRPAWAAWAVTRAVWGCPS